MRQPPQSLRWSTEFYKLQRRLSVVSLRTACIRTAPCYRSLANCTWSHHYDYLVYDSLARDNVVEKLRAHAALHPGDGTQNPDNVGLADRLSPETCGQRQEVLVLLMRHPTRLSSFGRR